MLLSFIVESIISCFGRTFRAPHHLGGCNFMDSFWEVMNWVTALRIQEPNRNATKNMKRRLVKGRSHDAQLQILFQLPQELVSFSLLFGEGNGNPLQYSCLENPREKGACWATWGNLVGNTLSYRVAQSRTWLKWLSSSSSPFYYLFP